MTAATVLLFSALAAMLVAALVLRAKWCRENQLLALALVLDAVSAGQTALLILRQQALDSPEALHAILVSKMLLLHPLLEFVYAFPFGRKMPRALRYAGVGATALWLALASNPHTAAAIDTWTIRIAYSVPFAFQTLRVTFRNLRELADTAGNEAKGARALLLVISYRWISEFISFVVIRSLWPDLFSAAFLHLGTFSVLASYIVIVHAVLIYHSLRVGDLLARTTLQTLLLGGTVALIIVAEDFLSRYTQAPLIRGLALSILALMLWGGSMWVRRFGAKLPAVFLPFSQRRIERESVLEKTLVDSAQLTNAADITSLTTSALVRLNGGHAEFSAMASDLDRPEQGPLLLLLEDPEINILTREQSLRLSAASRDAFAATRADVLIPVRAYGKLLGMLTLRGLAKFDPDVLETSKALADNLATNLAHHALYERAFQLQSQLEESRQLTALGSFAAAIAHDIRTPLTSVRLNIEMLKARVQHDEESSACVLLAQEELVRMTYYVSGILDFVKPVQLRAAPHTTLALIDELTKLMQPLLESRKLQLHRELPPDDDIPLVNIDLLRVRQALANIITNAVDASAPGKSIYLTVCSCNPEWSVISVCDQGDGIASDALPRIFEPFFTTRSDGTGLGLAIARKLIEAHGGALFAASTLGSGSAFTVALPSVRRQGTAPWTPTFCTQACNLERGQRLRASRPAVAAASIQSSAALHA